MRHVGDAIFARDDRRALPGRRHRRSVRRSRRIAGSDMLAVGGDLGPRPAPTSSVGQVLGGRRGGRRSRRRRDRPRPPGGRVDTGIAAATAPYLDLVGPAGPSRRRTPACPVTGTADVTDDGDHADRRRGLQPAGLHRRRRRSGARTGRPAVRSSCSACPHGRRRGREHHRYGGHLDVDTLLDAGRRSRSTRWPTPTSPSLATHLLWNAPSATTVDIGGQAQLPGSPAGPDRPEHDHARGRRHQRPDPRGRRPGAHRRGRAARLPVPPRRRAQLRRGPGAPPYADPRRRARGP